MIWILLNFLKFWATCPYIFWAILLLFLRVWQQLSVSRHIFFKKNDQTHTCRWLYLCQINVTLRLNLWVHGSKIISHHVKENTTWTEISHKYENINMKFLNSWIRFRVWVRQYTIKTKLMHEWTILSFQSPNKDQAKEQKGLEISLT